MSPAEEKTGPTSRQQNEALHTELMAALPEDRSGDPERWRLHELLAHLVCFHMREAKPVWWAMFERLQMSIEELAEDPDCLAGLERTATPSVVDKRSLVQEYRFDPEQDTKLHEGSKWMAVEDPKLKGVIHGFDAVNGLLELRSTKTLPDRFSMIPDEHVGTDGIEEAIRAVARAWQQTGKLPGALEDLLGRRARRIANRKLGTPVLDDGEATRAGMLRAVSAMAGTTLAIQGPPGAGKSTVGAATIAALVESGHRVGIAANSHEVIEQLMGRVMEAVKAARQTIRATKVGSDDDEGFLDRHGIDHVSGAKELDFEDDSSAPQLVGGTAWCFSHPVMVGQLDYLFVDETGQVSLANLVGMSASAENLVLLGDQMQLPQPLKATHPGDSGRSALEYLLMNDRGEVHATIPRELGIFLPSTYRMHPDVCRFISETIYEGRLQPEPHTKDRIIHRGKATRVPAESGLYFVPVEHEANVQESEEEVDAIVDIVAELRQRTLTTKQGEAPRPLTAKDMLVVAPYNRQVQRLRAALPDARVGTVDLFQGQEAPVVILSMCASSADDAPRGLEFLLNRNRLNVALSSAPPGSKVRRVQALAPQQRADLAGLRASGSLGNDAASILGGEPPTARGGRHLGVLGHDFQHAARSWSRPRQQI